MFKNLEIGIDLGTANTLVYSKNTGIVFNEPSVVAIDLSTNQVLAIGNEAKEMIGKTPANVIAVKPLKDGVIADFDITAQMLKHIMKKVSKTLKLSMRKPSIVVCIPSSATTVDRKAIQDAIRSCGAKHVFLIEEPVAAAIGADLPVDEPTANVVVDIGGGTTEVAIISYGGIVASNSINIGGDRLDEDIIHYIRKKYNLLIGEQTAEQIKIQIGHAPIKHDEKIIEIRGRDLMTGLPKNLALHSSEVQEALSESIQSILDIIRATLEQSPPELSGDIVDLGVVLTGGGSLLQGMEQWVANEIDVPVHLAAEPLESVVIGTGRSLQVMSKLVKA